MKYFGLVVLLVCLGVCADDYGSRSNYRRWGQLNNYDGIYSTRYDYDREDYYGGRLPGGQYNGTGGQISGQGGAFVGGNVVGGAGIAGSGETAGNAGIAGSAGIAASGGLAGSAGIVGSGGIAGGAVGGIAGSGGKTGGAVGGIAGSGGIAGGASIAASGISGGANIVGSGGIASGAVGGIGGSEGIVGGTGNNGSGGIAGGTIGGFGGGGEVAGGLGLAAESGESAGLGAGISGSYENAIGVGTSSNVQLNLEAVALGNREDVIRPCNLDDWQCIRKFFAVNSQCSPSYGPVPDPLFFDQSTLYIPYVNLNLLLTNVRITGMSSARIRDFYVNRLTGNLVFTIDLENLNQTSPRSYWKYNRRGREPYLLADVTAFAFAKVSLTVVIPRLPNLRLDLAEVSADYGDDSPTYNFGPTISNSTNSLVVSANAELSANFQAVIRESFFFQAQLLAAIYIQQNICDFGLRLTST